MTRTVTNRQTRTLVQRLWAVADTLRGSQGSSECEHIGADHLLHVSLVKTISKSKVPVK